VWTIGVFGRTAIAEASGEGADLLRKGTEPVAAGKKTVWPEGEARAPLRKNTGRGTTPGKSLNNAFRISAVGGCWMQKGKKDFWVWERRDSRVVTVDEKGEEVKQHGEYTRRTRLPAGGQTEGLRFKLEKKKDRRAVFKVVIRWLKGGEGG